MCEFSVEFSGDFWVLDDKLLNPRVEFCCSLMLRFIFFFLLYHCVVVAFCFEGNICILFTALPSTYSKKRILKKFN